MRESSARVYIAYRHTVSVHASFAVHVPRDMRLSVSGSQSSPHRLRRTKALSTRHPIPNVCLALRRAGAPNPPSSPEAPAPGNPPVCQANQTAPKPDRSDGVPLLREQFVRDMQHLVADHRLTRVLQLAIDGVDVVHKLPRLHLEGAAADRLQLFDDLRHRARHDPRRRLARAHLVQERGQRELRKARVLPFVLELTVAVEDAHSAGRLREHLLDGAQARALVRFRRPVASLLSVHAGVRERRERRRHLALAADQAHVDDLHFVRVRVALEDAETVDQLRRHQHDAAERLLAGLLPQRRRGDGAEAAAGRPRLVGPAEDAH
eukprot:1943601-Prymnesium_polylepis.1